MRKRIFAVLMVMSLLIIGGLFYVPGIFASDEVGVVFFRVADAATPGGTPALNAGVPIEDAKFELERTADGVSMEIKTSGLPAGAYSIWWAIDSDNDPGSGASPGDALIVGVEAVRIATGGIVGANGVGKFEATLSEGPIPPANGVTVMLNFGGSQVFDPMVAGIAVVIRFHGPVIPGAVNEQTTLFAGGCSNTPTLGLPGAFPGADVCFDPQASEFARP